MDLEWPVFERRFVQLQKTMENGKEDLVLLAKREDTRKETEKEMPKGKDPKRSQFVRRVKQFGVHPFFRRGNAKRNPHAIIGIHQNAHTTNPKVDANEVIRVYSRSQAKPVTTNMAIQLWP